MSRLKIRCPVTNDVISVTDIESDARTLAGLWAHVLIVPCAHCNMSHEVTVRHAFIDEALSDDSRTGWKGSA